MNFRIEHFGKVREAEIKIDGLTVLAGPNGSGKSTISRALMTWCALIRRMSDVLLDERIKSAREAIKTILKANKVPAVDFGFGSDRQGKLKLLRPGTWLNVDEVESCLKDSFEYFFSEIRDVHAEAEKIVGLRDVIVSAVEEIAGREETFYVPSIVEDFFESAFDSGYASFRWDGKSLIRSISDAQKERMAEFDGGKVIDWKGLTLDEAPFAFYLEPLHLLDLYAQRMHHKTRSRQYLLSSTNRYHAEDVDWRNFLYNEVDKSSWSVERKKKQEEIESELDKIVEVIRGNLERRDSELKFVDKDAKHDVSVMNVASGAKTIGVIERGIRAGAIQPGSMLIIDEPESNLHPKWQIEFARFLIELNVKFGMKLVVNTHSPYFLKALEVYSREENIAQQAHYYFMESEDLGKSFVARELKDGTNVVFKTFFDSLNDLMGR